jgi:hypothetical protein
MSLSLDTAYNAHLRKMVAEMKPSPADVANQPEMIYGGTRQQKMVTPESLAYANPLHDVLIAEKQLSVGHGCCEGGELLGVGLLGDLKKGVKKATKSVKKGLKSDMEKVKKVAKDISKSKAGKKVGKVAKQTASLALDIAEKSAPALGALAGTAAAVASLNPELAPAAAAIGSAAADQLAKRGRKAVKEKTGLGKPKRPPSAWNLHVAEYRKANGGSLKDAMKAAKATYKK